MSGAAEGIEVRRGALGGLVAAGLGPRLGPADAVVAGGGFGGQGGEALEEPPTGRGDDRGGWQRMGPELHGPSMMMFN